MGNQDSSCLDGFLIEEKKGATITHTAAFMEDALLGR